jgi:hypothetical protein
MQIVVALVVIWLLFVVLSWVLHAVKLLLIIAIIASLAVIAAKYLVQLIR